MISILHIAIINTVMVFDEVKRVRINKRENYWELYHKEIAFVWKATRCPWVVIATVGLILILELWGRNRYPVREKKPWSAHHAETDRKRIVAVRGF